MPAEKRKINCAFSFSSTLRRSHSSLESNLFTASSLSMHWGTCVYVCVVLTAECRRCLLGVKDGVCSASVWSSGHMAHKHTAPQARPGPPRDTYTTKSLNNSKASAPFRYNKHCTETHTSMRPSAAFWFSGTGSFPSSWWKEQI